MVGVAAETNKANRGDVVVVVDDDYDEETRDSPVTKSTDLWTRAREEGGRHAKKERESNEKRDAAARKEQKPPFLYV